MRYNMKNILIYLLFVLPAAFSLFASVSGNDSPVVYSIRLDGDIINPVISKFISKSIDRASAGNAQCLVIELDTPGGLLESTREIVKEMLNAPLPVVVYVSPRGSRAASAGMFITCAAHIAAMAPSTHIGAAHPVAIGGAPSQPKPQTLPEAVKKTEGADKPASPEKTPEDIQGGEVMSKKIMEDTLAWASAIAGARNRNLEWMKEAVQNSVSATDEEALSKGIIDIRADSLENLLESINGRTVEVRGKQVALATAGAKVERLDLNFSEKFFNMLANPQIAYILMTLGMIGLVFEFTHPGVLFPGIAGLICLLLAFYSFNTLPVNYTGILLVLFSLVLFIAELFTPTFGVLALGGFFAFIFGSMMLIQSDYSFMRISLKIIIASAGFVAFVTMLLGYKVLKTQGNPVSTGSEGLIGTRAKTQTELAPEGKVFCHGEIWNAVSAEKQIIAKDTEVQIVEVKGLKLIVKPL